MNLSAHRVVAVALVVALGLALVVTHPTPSLAAPSLRVSPTNPAPREYVKISSRLGTSFKRPVRLQYWTGSKWAVLAKKSTTSTGAFAFRTRAVKPSRKFRAFAPRVSSNGRRYSAITTNPRTVKTVTPRASLAFVPAPIGQSKSGTQNLTPGTARFKPARKGRGVVLQRYVSGSWKTVQKGRQNGRGVFAFNTKAGSGQKFRAITVAKNGAPAKKSSTVAVAHLPRPFNDNFSGSALDSDNWAIRNPGSRAAGNRECSESSAKSVSLYNGKLELRTKRIPETELAPEDLLRDCPHGQFYNGQIGSENKYSFKHGIMAARIKLQPSRGHHGGFWSNPQSSPELGAEIDALEFYGNQFNADGDYTSKIQHTIYQLAPIEVKAKVYKNRNYLLRSGRTWSSDYHVFSVEWNANRYIFRIDGHETFRTSRQVSEVDQYLILSLLSSDYELKHGPTTSPMLVDWVRVWDN